VFKIQQECQKRPTHSKKPLLKRRIYLKRDLFVCGKNLSKRATDSRAQCATCQGTTHLSKETYTIEKRPIKEADLFAERPTCLKKNTCERDPLTLGLSVQRV